MRIAHRCFRDEDSVVNAQTRSERRWGPRIQVDLPVRMQLTQGRTETGRMRNVSMSGAMIECSAELPTFTTMRIEILAGAEVIPAKIELAARVVRAEHPCLGVEWREFQPQALADLLKASTLPLAGRPGG
ncbi:MAG TPA: PilZ domain-containing protein [Steroidobacteraceae bacterium]|nr:PilZ domain-containing protein [Steroidobacteraceae bacterium]